MDTVSDPSQLKILATPGHLVSITAFNGIVWTGIALCTVAFGCRAYMRIVCFRHLLFDDYLMIVALTLLLVIAIIGQIVLQDVFDLMDAGIGKYQPGPSFLKNSRKGLRGFGIVVILSYIGIWIIKLNFLLFFRRLGSRFHRYIIFWWTVLFVTIACGAVSIGAVQYKCLFGPISTIFSTCGLPARTSQTYTYFKISCIIDVISDTLILCFPFSILWKTQISVRRKLVLSAIFSLVAFTIAVAIVRGSIFGGVYKSIDDRHMRQLNITWMWFWYYVEFAVSFIIACLVSFRALFGQSTQRGMRRRGKTPRQHKRSVSPLSKKKGIRGKAAYLHESLLDTCKSLDGTGDVDAEPNERHGLPVPPSGRLSVDFLQEREMNGASDSKFDQLDSIKTLDPAHVG